MNKSAPRGRRVGKPDTRAAILDAAQRRFMADGYQAVSLRAIAAEAGVDVALISYFFGSKRGLFGAVMTLETNPAEVLRRLLAGDPISLPQRALGDMITLWDDDTTGARLRLLLRSAASDPAMTTILREVLEVEMIGVIAEALGGRRDDRKRAAAFSAVMAGILFTRYLLEVEPVKSMRVDELVRLFAPVLGTALALPAGRRGVIVSR
jgi:AcrR family transcriptional regulator